jgi:hypothetical protein
MDLKEIGWETMNWIHMVGSSESGRDLRVPENAENFLRS